jgi:Transposase
MRACEIGAAMTEGAVAGIDWASEVHVACVIDGGGAVTGRFSFTHDAAAIRSMVRRLCSADVAGVAIERGEGPVVEELLSAGLAVFVVPSRQAKGVRTRYGSAGNKDERLDAYVLADTLRTDGHRRECVFGRGTGRDRRVRAAVSAARRLAGSGAGGAGCGGLVLAQDPSQMVLVPYEGAVQELAAASAVSARSSPKPERPRRRRFNVIRVN